MKETKAYKTYLGFATGATPPKIANDSNNDNNSESDDNDEENDSDDDNTQSENEKGSDSRQETDENEPGSKFDHQENEEEVEDDEEKMKEEYVRTPSYYSPTDDEYKTNVDDNAEGDKDEEMDYTTSHLYNDVDIRLNKPVQTDEGLVQKKDADAEMINVQQGNENLKTTLDQVIKDAHVTINTVSKKTESLVTSSSHSSDLVAKFLNFLDIPITEAKSVSSMDVPVHHETTNILQSLQSFTPPPLLSTPTPPPITEAINPQSVLPDFACVFQFHNRVWDLEKDVSKLKKYDPRKTQVTNLVDENLDARLDATRDEFMSYLSTSITARITEQVKIQIPYILPDEVSNFPPPPSMIQRMVTESLKHVILAKSEEPEFKIADSDMLQDQEKNPSNDDEEPKGRVASKCYWFTKPKRPQEPTNPNWNDRKTLHKDPLKAGPTFKLLKGTRTNYAELEYDFKECYNALSEKLNWEDIEGVTRVEVFHIGEINVRPSMNMIFQAVQYDLPGIERVEDLQLRVESYQKKINITKPETTKPGIKKKDPYTPYQDPQGFIYVDTLGINSLMHSDELYKFNDGTLTRL
nr:hypothetical protein [Tanacetum cinerariifolium]